MSAHTNHFWRRSARQALWLLVLALIPAMLTATLHPRRPAFAAAERVAEITVATASGWANVLWIDARDEADYRRGHVPGATLLNEDRWSSLLPQFLEAWTPERRIVIYCNSESCDASQSVARRLRRELQIENVFVLRGGWTAWSEAQKP